MFSFVRQEKKPQKACLGVLANVEDRPDPAVLELSEHLGRDCGNLWKRERERERGIRRAVEAWVTGFWTLKAGGLRGSSYEVLLESSHEGWGVSVCCGCYWDVEFVMSPNPRTACLFGIVQGLMEGSASGRHLKKWKAQP